MDTSFERRLGLFSVITISLSSMVGGGIFILPGVGFEVTGPSLYIAFLLAALCILPAAMSKAELATAMPTSGGTYVYMDRTFGPLVGTVSGLGLFLSILLKASFSLVGVGAYFSTLSNVPLLPTVMSFLVVIVILNLLGVGKVSSILTTILFVSLFALASLTLASIPAFDVQNMEPLFPKGKEGLFSATALVFVSFAGVTKIAAIAEEVIEPEKNLPRGILASLVIVTIIYCSISLILSGHFTAETLGGDLKPIHTLATKVGGPLAASIFSIIAIFCMVNVSNAGILAGSRFPFAMARDSLLPGIFGKLQKKLLTPVNSIILSGAIIAGVLLFLDVTKIAKLASAFMIIIYVMENLAVIVLRETRTQWYKPAYRSPFYPVLQSFGVISGLALLFAMGQIVLLAVTAISIPGVLLFIFYGAKRTNRKGVLGIRGKRTDLLSAEEDQFQKFRSITLNQDAQIVVGLFGKERSPEVLVEMGVAMAHHSQAEVVNIIEIPEQTNLFDFIEEPPEIRSLRRRIRAMADDKDELISFDTLVSHDISKTIYEISHRLHCQWLLIEWRGKARGTITFDNRIGWLKSHLRCHLAIFRDTGVRYFRKIMVLINADKNDKLVMETADHLAEVYGADITLVRFSHEMVSPEKKKYEHTFLSEVAKTVGARTHCKVLSGTDEIKEILAQTVDFDLFILGSTDHSLTRSVFGAYDDKLMQKASCSVLSVHASSNPSDTIEVTPPTESDADSNSGSN